MLRGTLEDSQMFCRTSPPPVPKLLQGPTRSLCKIKSMLLSYLSSLLPAFSSPVTGDRLPEQGKVIPKILVCKPEQGAIWFKTVSPLFCYGYVSECDTYPTPTLPPPLLAGKARQAHWGVLTLPEPASMTSSRHLIFQQPCLWAVPSKRSCQFTWWLQLFR